MEIQRKIYFAVIGSLILALLLGVFAVGSLFKGIKNASGEILNLRQELAFLNIKKEEQVNLGQKMQILEPDLERIQDLFIDLKMPIIFLEFLEKTAKDSNVLIEISLPGTPANKTEEESFSSLRFYVIAVGLDADALKFLDRLETAPYLIEIEDLTMANLTESQLKTKEYEKFSLGAVELKFSIEVMADGYKNSSL